MGYVIVGDSIVFGFVLKDIFDYLGKVCITSDELMIMFWNSTTKVSKYPWLRSSSDNSDAAWSVDGGNGSLFGGAVILSVVVRPALNLNLSLIPFSVAP